MGFYYNKKMKARSTSVSGSESGSGSDSERFSSSGSSCLTDQDTIKFAGARFTSPPMPDAVPLPPKAWLQTENQLTFVTSDLKSMLQIRA
jgi:hypothetical protein